VRRATLNEQRGDSTFPTGDVAGEADEFHGLRQMMHERQG
jgi:hypothetical protein